ncbi:unnamed protein product [Bursaphelenchus xylophilus]|uniref:(pine wood nematode) hypothetical protein n=1 Tax=Bursaphelenchus xylophilus TaxID=6326 RepID=A0A7I8WYK9_BURXY|nr:unnamed protein product [Bursaphelenchus xylophilus]CAG9101235.1 unnamed protein product [Bursaphelenchus xylophilus]
MASWITVIFLLIGCFSTISQAIWCLQGGVEYTPIQCAPEVVECFRFECLGEDAAEFVARGCGLPGGHSRRNESCQQAKSVCSSFGEEGKCEICSEKHMCNSSHSLFSSLEPIFLLILGLFPCVFQ